MQHCFVLGARAYRADACARQCSTTASPVTVERADFDRTLPLVVTGRRAVTAERRAFVAFLMVARSLPKYAASFSEVRDVC